LDFCADTDAAAAVIVIAADHDVDNDNAFYIAIGTKISSFL